MSGFQRASIRLPRRNSGLERWMTGCIWLAVGTVTGLFLWILGDLVLSGIGGLSWTFLSQGTADAGRAGGIFPILVSTLWILGIALLVAVPPGLATAAWLAEFQRRNHRFGRWVRRSLDILAAVPSIVFGLFGNALFSQAMGLGYSLLAGGLTLACMILPLLIRSLEMSFRAVPDDYRLAAAALAMGRARTLGSVLLPAALPGLLVGIVLAVGRVLAETAALLFTSGYVDRMPRGVMDSGRSLSIHIYDLAMNVPGGETNAYGTALVLVILLLIINWTALQLGDRWQRRMTGIAGDIDAAPGTLNKPWVG